MKSILRTDEKYALAALFYNYPSTRLWEMINDESEPIPEHLHDYLPYIESQLQVALFKALDEYNKGTERSKKRRPQYFKRFVDEVSKNHIKKVVMQMSASITRTEGRNSSNPTKADTQLYKKLQLIKKGQNPLEAILSELER